MIKDILKEQKHMTEIEKRIADYLLEHQNHIQEQSAHDIASKLYIHPSTITRFCQKIGYQGYSDFQKAYNKEIQYFQTHFQNVDPNYPFDYHDKNIIVAHKIGQLYHEIIDDTLHLMEHDSLQNIINLLRQSEIIFIYSAGVQADLAQIFKDKMLKIGKNVIVELRIDELFYRASFCNQKSLFIIISYSGEIEAELRGVKKLKERHIPLIAITTYGKNTLSQEANYVLFVSTREKLIYNLGDFAMNLSTLLILDILYVNIFNTDFYEHYQQKITSSQEFEIHRKSNNMVIDDSKNKSEKK